MSTTRAVTRETNRLNTGFPISPAKKDSPLSIPIPSSASTSPKATPIKTVSLGSPTEQDMGMGIVAEKNGIKLPSKEERMLTDIITNGGFVKEVSPDQVPTGVEIPEGTERIVEATRKPIEADEERTETQEKLWIFIDGLGTLRNIVATTSTSIKIGGGAAMVAIPALAVAVGGIATIGGVSIITSALLHNRPLLNAKIKEARDDKDPTGVRLARCGYLTSVVFYLGFGVGLTGMGVADLFTPEVVQLLTHGASAGFERALDVTTAFGSYFLGALCVARGTLIGGRALYTLRQTGKFDTAFYKHLEKGNVGALLRQELLDKDKGIGHFKRMVGPIEKGGELDTWVKNAQKGAIEEPSKAVLEKIDRHIHRTNYYNRILLFIATLMIIGGICALLATGGGALSYAALALSLVSSVSGTGMEMAYLHYDTSSWVESSVRSSYEKNREEKFERAHATYLRKQLEDRPVKVSLIDDNRQFLTVGPKKKEEDDSVKMRASLVETPTS